MNKIKNEINDIFDESSNIILDSKKLSNDIIKAATLIIKSLQTGNKIIIFGNCDFPLAVILLNPIIHPGVGRGSWREVSFI